MDGTEQAPGAPSVRAGRDRSDERLRALSEIGAAATRAPQSEAIREVLLAAMRALGSQSASLGVWDKEARLLRIRYNVGELADWEVAEPIDETYAVDQDATLEVMSDGLIGEVYCVDDPELGDYDREFLESIGKRSSMTTPVLYAGDWWGQLFSARVPDEEPFTDADLDWGAAVAAQVGAALESIEHLSRMGRLAQTDPLTGLANRRALDEWLERAAVGLRVEQRPIGLAVCDVNGLKTINDEQGHDAGDRALVQFAEFLTQAQGELENTIVARLGGDEFCIAVAGPAVHSLEHAANEVCRKGWDALPYGIACGLVSTVERIGPIDNVGRLFRLADAAQYRAKRTESKVPVIAGRALPPELAVPIIETSETPSPDRRLLRGRGDGEQARLLAAALRALDQAATETISARLGLVADLVTHHIDGLGWWISFAAPDADAVRTAEFAIYRAIVGVRGDELQNDPGSSFLLSTYPQTALAMRGGSFIVHANDLTADPAELAILDGLGATSVVAAGGTDLEGDRWLVEVFSDGLSASPIELASTLRLLLLAALHPPRSA